MMHLLPMLSIYMIDNKHDNSLHLKNSTKFAAKQ